MLNFVIAGSNGLIGSAIVRELGSLSDVRSFALVRRRGALGQALAEDPPRNATEYVFDFTQEASYAALGTPELACDILLCAIGTTMGTAGSREAFLAVDREIPLRLIARAQQLSKPPIFGLVSSVGADKPRGFYLQTKAEVERALQTSGLPYVIARPSLLLGQRQESRFLEALAGRAMPAVMAAASKLTGERVASLGRFTPIAGTGVAHALIEATRAIAASPQQHSTQLILEGLELHQRANLPQQGS